MNPPPPSPDRSPDAELTDELLSAALDGELDAAAADLGLAPDEARALVEQNASRGAVLGGARDRLAEAPPTLDEVTRRRLVSRAAAAAVAQPASGGAASARGRRRLAAVAAVAAALALFGAVAALLRVGIRGDAGNDYASGDAKSESTEAATALAPTADLGEVSDPAVLRSRLDESASATLQATGSDGAAADRETTVEGAEEYSTTERAADQGSDASGDPGSTPAPAESSPGSGGDQPEAVGCPTFLAADFDDVGPPVLVATATYEGRPAGVIVFGSDTARLAVVYDAAECTIFATQSLTTP